MDPQRQGALLSFFNAECAVAVHSRPTLYLGAMNSLQHLIEVADPDIDWIHILSQSHKARGTDYELQISRVSESGQFRVYIASAG
jgi:hypothetical protein